MRLVGFGFNKISAEKKSDNFKDLKINTGIDISSIKEVKSEYFKSKEELIGVTFEYTISYEPDYGKLNFTGNVLLGLENKQFKEVLRRWKDKELPDDFRLILFNIILKKSSIKAMELEEDLNMPLHVPLPSLTLNKKKE